ncbi:MAG: hypothetical protein ACRDOY_04770 [Nocardioidaceae bacterium]
MTGPEMEPLVDLVQVTLSPALPREKFEQVDSLRRQTDTSSASPYAVAIAAIAADSSLGQVMRLQEEGLAADALHTAAVVGADVAGGIAGVFIGDALCGPICGVMDGAAGAAGASIAVQEHLPH